MATRGKKRFYLFALLLLLLFAEGALRLVFALQGYTVGSFAPNWFPKTTNERPVFEPSYFADSTGLFRASETYWQARGVAVNSLGFKGGEWLPVDTSKARILFLGDSFVWGAGAEPLDASFADRLAKSGNYTIYNAGIPGADPAQYRLAAEKYIPLLQPDVVVVCVYLGNDLMAGSRQPLPGKALYFPTDKGWFPGYYQGRYFDSLEESYGFYLAMYSPQGWFQKLACKTALGTALYSLPLRLKERRDRQALLLSTVTNGYLKEIQSLAEEQGTKLLVLPIPYLGTDFKGKNVFVAEDLWQLYPVVFPGLEANVRTVPFAPSYFHPLPDGHFNNLGHEIFADSIEIILSRAI